MKMLEEDYNVIVKAFEENKEGVLDHYTMVKESGRYNVLEHRVAIDCLRMFAKDGFITEQYDKGLNDNHIITATVKALKGVLGV